MPFLPKTTLFFPTQTQKLEEMSLAQDGTSRAFAAAPDELQIHQELLPCTLTLCEQGVKAPSRHAARSEQAGILFKKKKKIDVLLAVFVMMNV